MTWAHAFQAVTGANPSDAVKRTAVKVIHTDPASCAHRLEEEWASQLMGHGIHISFLSQPCLLHHVPGKRNVIAEQEMRHALTKRFWQQCQEQPVAAAIPISHLRAIHEGLSISADIDVLIVLEGDVVATENTHQLLAALIANMNGNDALKDCDYVAMTFSDWHAGHANKARTESTPVPGAYCAPYFKMGSLPYLRDPKSGQWRYAFIGQGARAIAYRRSFAEQVLEEPVGTFWDMHLLQLITKKRTDAWWARPDKPFLACYCDPPIFTHVPKFSTRLRGSGRLESMTESSAEEFSHYITIDLNHQWGVCNRIQTLALLCGFASLHNLGVYCLWPENSDVCKGSFSECFGIDTSSPVYDGLAFLRFYTNPRDSNWLAALSAPQWNVGKFSSQCQVEMGIEAFFQHLDRTARADRDITYLHTVAPRWKQQLTEAYCWQLVYVHTDIMQAAAEYMDPSGTGALAENYHHVAFHVRRGDHKYLNCDKVIQQHSGKSKREKTEIERQWQRADEEVEASASTSFLHLYPGGSLEPQSLSVRPLTFLPFLTHS